MAIIIVFILQLRKSLNNFPSREVAELETELFDEKLENSDSRQIERCEKAIYQASR